MPKKKGEGLWFYIFMIVLFFLLLKAFRVLPDPPQYLEVVAGVGAAAGVIISFLSLFSHMLKFEHRLTTVEAAVKVIQEDIKAIKTKLGI